MQVPLVTATQGDSENANQHYQVDKVMHVIQPGAGAAHVVTILAENSNNLLPGVLGTCAHSQSPNQFHICRNGSSNKVITGGRGGGRDGKGTASGVVGARLKTGDAITAKLEGSRRNEQDEACGSTKIHSLARQVTAAATGLCS
jgi:hypothetical protein